LRGGPETAAASADNEPIFNLVCNCLDSYIQFVPSPLSPPKWRRRSDARPEEILEAALLTFTEQGFDAARMEDVAKRAGLSKAGVYLYFPSKIALLKALIEAKVAPLARQAEAVAAAGAAEPLRTLRQLAGIAAHTIGDPRNFATPRLVIAVSGRFPEIAHYYRANIVEPARAAIARLIAAGIARGEIRAVDPQAAVRALIGPLLFEALWTHVLGGESALADPEKLIEQHFDILLNGLETSA
jgi:AcrR family transcriptional regulator